MGADDTINNVYYNGLNIGSTVANLNTGANVVKTFSFTYVPGAVAHGPAEREEEEVR